MGYQLALHFKVATACVAWSVHVFPCVPHRCLRLVYGDVLDWEDIHRLVDVINR
jgi:hypothetical protein